MLRPSLLLAACLILSACGAGETTVNRVSLSEARLDAVDSNGANISITDCPKDHVCEGPTLPLTTDDAGIETELKRFHVGDRLNLAYEKGNRKIVSLTGLAHWDVPAGTRIITLVLFAVLLLGFAALATKGAPQSFVIGADNRYSNSKFQIAMWFWLLLTTYLSAICLRVLGPGWSFFGSVNIPQNLLLISGLSAITYGGAKAITQAKVDAATAAGVADPKPAAVKPNFFADLVENDGTAVPSAGGGVPALNTAVRSFDFGDFQMLVVTFLALIMYLLAAYHFLGQIQFAASVTLPDVDTTILSAFGLGQGAYLVKKGAGNIGTT